jgi:hypothetical protein
VESHRPTLRIAQDPAADDLLGRDPLALLVGMLLDQHLRQRRTHLRGWWAAARGAGACVPVPGQLRASPVVHVAAAWEWPAPVDGAGG